MFDNPHDFFKDFFKLVWVGVALYGIAAFTFIAGLLILVKVLFF